MYWYKPTTRASERVQAPSTDEQALQMLAGTQDSAELIKNYCELRRSETPIEQALVLVGHEFRLSQPEVSASSPVGDRLRRSRVSSFERSKVHLL